MLREEEEERKEIEELSRQRDLICANEEKALQEETLLVEEKKVTASGSCEDFHAEIQSQMAFLLNQQVMIQQGFSALSIELKTAFCDMAAQFQKPSSLVVQDNSPRISTEMQDAPQSSPLTESTVFNVASSESPLSQYTPPITTAPSSMPLVQAQPQLVQSPLSVPQQPPLSTNAEMISDLQHLEGSKHGAPVGQRMVQSTPGDLCLGHKNEQNEMGTQGEQLQLIVTVNDEVTR